MIKQSRTILFLFFVSMQTNVVIEYCILYFNFNIQISTFDRLDFRFYQMLKKLKYKGELRIGLVK